MSRISSSINDRCTCPHVPEAEREREHLNELYAILNDPALTDSAARLRARLRIRTHLAECSHPVGNA